MINPIDEYGQKYINSRQNSDPRPSLLSQAEKKIKNARICLIIVGVLTMAVAIISYNFIYEDESLILQLIDVAIGMLYIALALWVNKKPRIAVLCGLILYISTFVWGKFN